jgi:hypothetical protein
MSHRERIGREFTNENIAQSVTLLAGLARNALFVLRIRSYC